ncbi:and integrin-binding 1-like [Octopus vulgaris]|uniref:And integrin-binding 1-like n=2 Tax=Octopus TaxID=6643 RepID=A0AA36B2M0_OCTVU|nr:and integrin-binding 1-like [Octopus vulgaris]
MGQSSSCFTDRELEAYETATYLSRNEIHVAFKTFWNLDKANVSVDRNCALPMETIQSLPELKVNPFQDRICQVFSTNDNGALTFEDFLDMLSVFNDKSTLETKLEYAFRIYDFDDDKIISRSDIEQAILCLIKMNHPCDDDILSEEQIEFLIDKVMDEADMDIEDGIGYAEFCSLMRKKPEFLEYFSIRL